MLERIYLDHVNGRPLIPEVSAAVRKAVLLSANPSSLYAEGRRASQAVEIARTTGGLGGEGIRISPGGDVTSPVIIGNRGLNRDVLSRITDARNVLSANSEVSRRRMRREL